MQLLLGEHVGEAHGATVERRLVVAQQRVLVGELCPGGEHRVVDLGLDQRGDVARVCADVVERDVVGGQRADEGAKHAATELVDVEQAAHVADQVEQLPIPVLRTAPVAYPWHT